MSSVRREITVLVPAATAWDAVRDFGALHTRLVPGMVTNTVVEDGGAFRIVTFEDGGTLKERIISVDDDRRRLTWSVVSEPFEHHNASVEVIGNGRSCRVIWIADMFPHELAETVASIMERGLGVTKATLERAIDHASPSETPSSREVFCQSDRPQLHHISLFVADLEVSVKFYTSGLGLTFRERFNDIVGRRATGAFSFDVASVFLEAGDRRYVELHPAGAAAMSPPGFPLNHLALAVADVDAAYKRAIEAGAKPIEIPIPGDHWDGTPLNVEMAGDRPEQMRMAFLQGPDGELVELYQASGPH